MHECVVTMDSSNKGLASSSSGKKMMIKPDGTKAVKKLKMKKIEVIYTTAIPCTVEELDRRNGVHIETNSNPNNPDQTGSKDEEAKQLKVDGEEKKINDLASTSKSAGIKKRSSSSSDDETDASIAFENKRKKRSNQLSISSDVNSKQPMKVMMKEHTTKEGKKMELANYNNLTISDSSPVKDQARAGPSLLQLTDLLENFDVCCKIGKGSTTASFVEEKEITGKGSTASFVDELRIGPPGSGLPSSDQDRGNALSLTIGNDHIDRDSSDSLMSAAMSILEADIHKKPAAFTVFRLMGKDILILVNAPPNNL